MEARKKGLSAGIKMILLYLFVVTMIVVFSENSKVFYAYIAAPFVFFQFYTFAYSFNKGYLKFLSSSKVMDLYNNPTDNYTRSEMSKEMGSIILPVICYIPTLLFYFLFAWIFYLIKNKQNRKINYLKSKENIFEQEIDSLYENKKYDEVILKAFDLSSNGKQISLKNKQHVALSYYYKKDYKQSLSLFEEIALKKNDVESLFNVLMSLMPLNKTQQGKEVFNKLIKFHKEMGGAGKGQNFVPQLCIPFIRYYYANALLDAKLFEDALEQLEELKKIYIELKITDDTFLYIRGIPFMSDTLDLAKKIFEGLNMNFSNSDFLNELKIKVDDDGKDIIKKFE